MPNDIANNMADTINQLEKELKDLREENKVLMQECDRLIKEKGELLSKVSGGDVLRICQLEEQLEKAKRLLRLAVKDINLMTPFKSCSFCSFNNTNLCDPNVPCALQATWKYNDEVNDFLESGD